MADGHTDGYEENVGCAAENDDRLIKAGISETARETENEGSGTSFIQRCKCPIDRLRDGFRTNDNDYTSFIRYVENPHIGKMKTEYNRS